MDASSAAEYRPDGRTWDRPALVDSCVRYGGGGSNLIRAVQRKLSLTADGLLGPATIRSPAKHSASRGLVVLDPAPPTLAGRLNTGRF
ncbi:MAG: hypothetical protein ACLRL4_00135 [Bifidobacterium bifidum]